MLSAIASGLVFPWTEQIVLFLLGANYAESWSVLAIMLLYPIHLPMGVIGGSTLLAIGQTHKHMLICVIAMLLSMPIAYLMLAPVTAGGLAFGALGLAIKLVSLNVISTNIQAWVIARYNGWKFDWLFQVVGIPLMIALGYLLKLLAGLFWNLHDTHITNMILPVLLTGVLYTSLVILTIWLLPWLIGLERNEIKKIFIPLGIQMKSLLGLG
jgi:O-antigen/teichoic acid export membrane protein